MEHAEHAVPEAAIARTLFPVGELEKPEKEDIESNYIDRDFLFDLVHTLEPTFFKRVLKEYYDAHR